uniref:Reverse transcriptase domain-containing protein n=1 Tax=Chromera velia CCMP2878 TaxID=1169474 RepID=A0A0G4HJB6_9ALVE|eukprot:Cvel_28085.t1-p1 / transcript=Cvel_28085.t1 / gene=Cvel_28085 / organism=Chromera_velia_CCMP2878 / gene_product=Retrotransposable element SLACS 132 kDa protein, putative / transcript_product=Retrotransposable element SLACS 132 kDa protein, putative / location=Cvel_scaffold3612:1447-3771(+) / protein_length=715 / sequence_SO=supercontig / SO=protein_coding / is_pseudo=false
MEEGEGDAGDGADGGQEGSGRKVKGGPTIEQWEERWKFWDEIDIEQRGGDAALAARRQRITTFWKGDFAELIKELREDIVRLRERRTGRRGKGGPRKTKGEKQEESCRHVKSLIADGALSKAASRLESFGVAKATVGTFQKLRALNPPRTAPYTTRALEEATTPLAVTADSLLQAARSAPRGSAQGLTGWRYEHIRFFLPGDGSGYSSPLIAIAHQVAEGNAPLALLQLLAGGRSFALNKDAKETKIRPIVVGDVLRRWVTKAILIQYGGRFEKHLGSLQFAVKTSAGTNKLFRTVQTCLQSFPSPVLLQLDSQNAFNTCDRQAAMDELHKHFPELYSFFSLWYGAPATLFFRDKGGRLRKIQCEEGVQQGDVAGSLLFCLGLKPVLDQLQRRLQTRHGGRGCFIGAYMDDISMVFPGLHPSALMDAWQDCSELLKRYGLTLNLGKGKSAAHSPSWLGLQDCPLQHPAGLEINTAGYKLMGAAGGNDSFVGGLFKEKVTEAVRLGKRVEAYGDLQGAFLLFRYCVFPKLMYLARVMGERISMDEWGRVDREMGELFLRTMHLTAAEWTTVHPQAHLPLSHGGLGIPNFQRTALAAVVGCCAQTIGAVHTRLGEQRFHSFQLAELRQLSWVSVCEQAFRHARERVKEAKLSHKHLLSPRATDWEGQIEKWLKEEGKQQQHEMTQALHRYGSDLLLQQQSETGRARLRSCAGGPASA